MALTNAQRQQKYRIKQTQLFFNLTSRIKKMEMKIFGIYDSKAEAYLAPFFMKSKGEAIRALTSHVNDSKHNFSIYSEDFTLFELGSWDDSNAVFTLHNTPYSLGVLIEFKSTPPKV